MNPCKAGPFMTAVEFTRQMDDGARPERWKDADILILGRGQSRPPGPGRGGGEERGEAFYFTVSFVNLSYPPVDALSCFSSS